MFGNFKLGVKLIGGFGAVLFLFACVMAMYQMAVSSTVKNFKHLMEHDLAIAAHAAKTESLMYQCQVEEKKFLAKPDAAGNDKVLSFVRDVEKEAQLVKSLSEQSGNESAAKSAVAILGNINSYKNAFQDLVVAMGKKGFTDESGLRGKFNHIVKRMMDDMSLHEIDAHYIELLKLRRFEAEYVLFQGEASKKKLNASVAAFEKLAARDAMNSVQEIMTTLIREAIPTYKEDLNALYQKGDAVSVDDEGYINMQETVDELQEVILSAYFSGAKGYVLDIRKHEKDYLLTGDYGFAESARTSVQSLMDAFSNSDVDEDYVEGAHGNLKEYLKAFNTLVETDKQISDIKNRMQDSVDKIGPLVKNLSEKLSNASAAKALSTEKNIRKRVAVAFFVGIAAIVLGIALSLVITRGITRPITRTVAFAENMAKGDLSQQLDINRKDEVGILALALNGMVSNLNAMFKDISNGVEEITKSSWSLSGISQGMLDGAEKTAERAGQVSDASEKMSSNTNSVASTMEEAAASMSIIASTTETMNATIGNISKNTDEARQISDTAVKQAENTTLKIEELETAAQDIGNVTETITEISEQTNLLALNATIESARAGEAGKGFAVVAGEIKTLAQQTADATKEISEKIEGAQSITRDTMTEINQITGVINKVNDIVVSIASAVNEQSGTTKEIAENIAQTSTGINEINDMMVQNSAVTGEIAQDITEVTKAAEEMTGSSSKVNESSEDLMHLAGRLKEMVSRFVL